VVNCHVKCILLPCVSSAKLSVHHVVI